MPCELSEKAADDLDVIYELGSDRFGDRQANRFFAELKDTLELIGESPRLCYERKEYDPPVRIQVHENHLIIYIIREESVVILRIVHGDCDWQSDFPED